MEKSAIANIQNAQASIEASLSASVRNISLQLSHLVFVNNGEIMELVSGMDTDDKEQRYDLSSRLDEIFRVSMVPSQDLSLIHILVWPIDGRPPDDGLCPANQLLDESL